MLLRLPNPEGRARADHDDLGDPTDRPDAERSLEVRFVGSFEGWSLITIAIDHEPAWLATELAWALGIDDPMQLLARVAERWHDGLQLDAIVYLDGGDRRELLDKLDRAHVVLPRSPRRKPLALLRPSALDALVASNDSAATRRLVSHLRERVIPEFYAHERAGRALEQPILSIDAATIAGNRLEFERRCFEAAVLERLLERLGDAGLVAGDLLEAHRVVTSEIALGGWLEDYREELTHGWSTPTQIAERWCGMTPIRVGKLIAELGLKGSRAHSRAYLTKARGHARTVIGHVYSPAAVGLIERELRSRGYCRCEHVSESESDSQ